MADISMVDIANILNIISEALEGTGYELKGFDNAGSSLQIFVDKRKAE